MIGKLIFQKILPLGQQLGNRYDDYNEKTY